jgi:phage replication initiation protein
MAMMDLLSERNAEKTTFEIINRYLRFADKDDTLPRKKWQTNKDWEWFIGKHRGMLRLTTQPEPYTFERTLNWLSHQVAPMLKVVSQIDNLNETTWIQDMILEAKLTEKHYKLIDQQTIPIEEMILKNK